MFHRELAVQSPIPPKLHWFGHHDGALPPIRARKTRDGGSPNARVFYEKVSFQASQNMFQVLVRMIKKKKYVKHKRTDAIKGV